MEMLSSLKKKIDISISIFFSETFNLYLLLCFGWHSSLSESSGTIPSALNRSKDFLSIFIQLLLCAHALVDHFSWASKHVFHYFAMISAHSAPYPAFQAQRVVV